MKHREERVVSVTAAGDNTFVVVGDLDVATGDMFVAAITGVLDDTDGTVHLDMSGVSFIDSGGLRALISMYMTSDRLRLVERSKAFDRLIALTGLDDIIC